MVSFLYYSHIFRDSYGSGMGIVWGPRGSHYSLKIPLILWDFPAPLVLPTVAADIFVDFYGLEQCKRDSCNSQCSYTL